MHPALASNALTSPARFAILAAAILLSSCASQVPLGSSADQRPSSWEARHLALTRLCATDALPGDAALADALGVEVAAVKHWREARSVTPDQACRMSAARLARSFAKGQSEVAATYSDAARRYNQGYYRGDDGKVSEDGKALALAARESLVVPPQKLGGVTSTSWTALGPEKLGGRVRTLAFDVGDAARIYVGSATGGIWISTDSGTTWAPVNDFSASLSISSFAQAASDPNTIYASTSELSGGFSGVGILKSTDRGATWQAMASTNPGADVNFRFTQSVTIDPANPRHLIVGTTCGLYRTTDAGATWNNPFQMLNGGFCGVGQYVVFSPGNPTLIIAGMSGRSVGRSVDGGANFARIQLGTLEANHTGRVEVAVSKSKPATWYASVNENSGDIYRSTDSGATWTKVSNPKHLGSQGEYGNVIWVDPTNPDVVAIGGIDIHRSTDGGATWTKVSDWVAGYRSGGTDAVSAHADHHAIVSAPGYNGTSNKTVYFGNDGGVFRNNDILAAANLVGWESISVGLLTTQFYAAHAKVYPAGLAVAGGLQDNSMNFLPAGTAVWKQPTTGDGTGAFFDANDPTKLTFGTQNLGLWRYDVTTEALELICQNITEATTFCNKSNIEAVNFIASFVVDPTNPERVLAGAASLWLSRDARTGSPPAWTIVKARSTALINGNPVNFINAVTQRADQPQVVYVGHENGEIYSTTDVYAATPAWLRRDVAGMPARRVNRIVIDPARPSRVFAVYSGATADNIWVSNDSGATWAALATSLPAVPVFSLAVRPSDANTLYAGTDVGLFVSTNGGTSWATTNDGPTGASIREVTFADANTIVVATYGRGAWRNGVAAAADTLFTLTVTRAGTGSGTVVSSPAVFNCGASCVASFASGATVSLRATPVPGSHFVGWSGACTGTGTCAVAMTAAKSVTATFDAGAAPLTASPTSIAFDGQSMRTTAPSQPVTITNGSASSITVTSVTASTNFGVAHNCAALAAGATCTANVTFTPLTEGAQSGALAVSTSIGDVSVALTGTGEKSLVTHYYRSILRRAPDAGGKAFWNSEAVRVQALGVSVNEVWFALAQQFYFSAEYAALNRDATGYVTDLYTTFFNRPPDTGGRDYWVGLINQGLPREVVLLGYMFSSEFASFTQAIFGAANTRKEVDTVVDFYRGLLARLPDQAGFNYWVGQFRIAQCQGGNAVNAQVEAISGAYASGAEYAARNRSDTQFVSDLYNSFLRRAGDLGGVQFWISQIATGARTRENVRQQFIQTPEFQARASQIIAQGCLP